MCIETNCDRKERMKYTKRAAEIVSSLSLHEKVSLMSGNMSFHEVRSAIRKKGKAHYNEILQILLERYAYSEIGGTFILI